MAIRVQLRIKCEATKRELNAVALVNSGFEAITPKLLIPVKAAEVLGLWPALPKSSFSRSVDTAGGVISTYVVPESLQVRILLEDRETDNVPCDAMISAIEKEILISDKLTSKLGAILEDVGEGIWRLRDDRPETKRYSEEPQLW